MATTPSEAASDRRGPVSSITALPGAPWRWMKRSVAAVVSYPVRNLGKHMPMG